MLRRPCCALLLKLPQFKFLELLTFFYIPWRDFLQEYLVYIFFIFYSKNFPIISFFQSTFCDPTLLINYLAGNCFGSFIKMEIILLKSKVDDSLVSTMKSVYKLGFFSQDSMAVQKQIIIYQLKIRNLLIKLFNLVSQRLE